jgi:hypothetical protein
MPDGTERPSDFGTHHCRTSSASVHASNTTSRGRSIVRGHDQLLLGHPLDRRAIHRGGGLSCASGVHRSAPSVVAPRRPARARRTGRPTAGAAARSTRSRPRVAAGRAGTSAPARPFSVVTSSACSSTPTCFRMPVRVMWNASARSEIDASPRPSRSRTTQRRGSCRPWRESGWRTSRRVHATRAGTAPVRRGHTHPAIPLREGALRLARGRGPQGGLVVRRLAAAASSRLDARGSTALLLPERSNSRPTCVGARVGNLRDPERGLG